MMKCCWGELLVVALNNAEQNAPAHSQERRTTALALFASQGAVWAAHGPPMLYLGQALDTSKNILTDPYDTKS